MPDYCNTEFLMQAMMTLRMKKSTVVIIRLANLVQQLHHIFSKQGKKKVVDHQWKKQCKKWQMRK